MKYKIVEKEEFMVCGYKKKIMYDNNTIPEFWQEVKENGTLENLYQINESQDGILGICVTKEDHMDYYIGIEADTGIYCVLVPKSKWIVFEIIGAMPDAIQKGWSDGQKYLKSKDFIIHNEFSFEYYYAGDVNSKDYKSEIWFSIK